MSSVQVAEKALDITLMFRRSFVVLFFELGVSDIRLAMFAPVFRL